MPLFMIQAAYTPEALATLINNPQDRAEAIRPVIESLGGKLENFWFTFGDYDVVAICQMPDNVSAAAFSFIGSAGGAVKAIKTTPLMSAEDAIEAFKKASALNYQPPVSR
jgi:uncharacterized protein with GYD domain